MSTSLPLRLIILCVLLAAVLGGGIAAMVLYFGGRSRGRNGAGDGNGGGGSRYRPGQVWGVRLSPEQPADARLIVLRVEELPKLGRIVHVALQGVRVPGGGTQLQHAPFSEAALDASVLQLTAEGGPIPDFSEGYTRWREANGGVFSIPVGEALQGMCGAVAAK
jgi:hypothetical protein